MFKPNILYKTKKWQVEKYKGASERVRERQADLDDYICFLGSIKKRWLKSKQTNNFGGGCWW